jgi:hypothetical protein
MCRRWLVGLKFNPTNNNNPEEMTYAEELTVKVTERTYAEAEQDRV